jgi:hypothetical protein
MARLAIAAFAALSLLRVARGLTHTTYEYDGFDVLMGCCWFVVASLAIWDLSRSKKERV